MARVSVTTNELLDAIRAAQEPEYPNAMTTPEICKALNLTRSKLRTIIAALEAAGRVQRVRVKRVDAMGRTQWSPAFILK